MISLRTKLLLLIIFTVSFSFFPVQATQAACNWINARDGCAKNQELHPDSKCAGIKKEYKLALVVIYDCCCDIDTSAEAKVNTKPPTFVLPDPQISIGAKFTEPTCEVNDKGVYSCPINWLGEYLTALYNYAIQIGGLLAAIMLMAGGLLWLVSAGDAGRISQAKKIISGSSIGLVLLFSTYIILTEINPNLVSLNPIRMGQISSIQMDDMIRNKDNSEAYSYANAACALDEELVNGTDFYATGYCKPAWEDSDKFRCLIAMNCSCPNGRDTSKNCDQWFGKTYPGYAPCLPFDADVNYCHQTTSGSAPAIGTIAGPPCDNLPLDNPPTQVCFDGKTYSITDRGGGIKGKRIDIWTGADCNAANEMTGVGILTIGPCQ